MASWKVSSFLQPFDCVVLVPGPRIDNGQILNQHRTLERILANWHQLDSALALANGILSIAERRIEYTENAKCFRIIRLFAHDSRDLVPRFHEGCASCCFVATQPSSKAFTPAIRERYVFVVAAIGRHCRQCALNLGRVALS